MSRLTDPHFPEILRRRLLVAGGEGVDSVGDELVPVIVLESDRPEYSFLQKERRCICWGAQGGAVDEFTYFQFTNPASSKVLAVITGIWGHYAADVIPAEAPIALYRQDATVGVPAPGICVSDTRWGEDQAVPFGLGSNCTLAWGTDPAVQGTLHFTLPFTTFFEPTGSTYQYNFYWKGDYILHPGRAVVLWSQAENKNVDLNVEFRERMHTKWEL